MFCNTPIYLSDKFKTNTQTFNNLSIKRKCSFCQKQPKGAMLMTIDTNDVFCDLVCGKLYDLNVKHIKPDMKDYRIKYLHGELNDKARLVYDKCIDKEFVQLLKMKIDYQEILNEPDSKIRRKKFMQAKQKYTSSLK